MLVELNKLKDIQKIDAFDILIFRCNSRFNSGWFKLWNLKGKSLNFSSFFDFYRIVSQMRL